jgi:hypothetical protein
MRGNHRRKIRRQYNVKTAALIREVANRIKNTPQNEIDTRLDAYERESIKFPAKWAKSAPIPEIMVILTKIGHPVTFQIMDERNPVKAFELTRASKEYHRRGRLDKLIELSQKHNYFCMTGSQVMKHQDLYSLLVGGITFKVNPNYTLFLKSALNKNPKDQKAVDDFILNLLENSEIGNFDFIDWKIIFIVRKYDDTPVNTLLIHERLSYTVEPNVIQRHLTNLTKHGFLQKFGQKKLSSYILTGKAWQAITEAKKEYFKGIRFFDNNESTEINGTAISNEGK